MIKEKVSKEKTAVHELKCFVLCNTLFSKSRGVMFKKEFIPHVFVFKKLKKIILHTFFCKPTKIICLDDLNKVTNITVLPSNSTKTFFAKTIIETMPEKHENILERDFVNFT